MGKPRFTVKKLRMPEDCDVCDQPRKLVVDAPHDRAVCSQCVGALHRALERYRWTQVPR